MLSDYFTENLIGLDLDVSTPEEAICAAGALLKQEGKIKQGYIDSMVKNFHDLGPYIVIAPGIAIPHGTAGDLVHEDCICFCRLKEPVRFSHPKNDPVKYVFAIGSNTPGQHLNVLVDLSRFLMNPDNIQRLGDIKSKEEFLELIKKGEEENEGS